MPPRRKTVAILPVDRVQSRILIIRGQRVILASDLARMYAVSVKQLNQAVRRNAERFPDEFVFQLTDAEVAGLSRSQFVTLKDSPNLKSHSATSRRGSNVKYRPYAFTEHGVLMAANVLRSARAAKASVFIIRAFLKLRELLSTHVQLAAKLDELERHLKNHDEQILLLFETIRELMEPPDDPPRPPIGFHTEMLPPDSAKARRR